MNARLPICLLALVLALPLAVAGCGNSGPLVLPEAVPADAPVDSDDQDVDERDVDERDVDATEPVEDDATTDDTIEEPGADPIPEVGGDDDGND
ncbi:hypothetical protein INQ41_12165 [Lysobacter ciconiae]|uniref:Sugar transporter n=1 Tax=Novilysobacter ciconiae TaxID=2781022 RepID=A0A7S6UFI9_9GAMM|nr:hypothetical protein [Lysobacter ciconiae]QOW19358.1 hypothetical protein INQ41_12165 [Lysobacter ciconiae]